MKNTKFRIIMALILVSIISVITISEVKAIDYTAPGNVQFRITLINQDPDPVTPGDTVDLRFRVENIGTRRADNPEFTIIPTTPLSVDASEATKTTGSIGGFQTGDDAVIVKFRLNVDSKATKGTASVKIRFKQDAKDLTSPTVETSAFNVSIRSQDAILTVKDVIVDPVQVTPGKPFSIGLVVKNSADAFVKNVRVKLDLSATTTPFAPLNSTNEKTIDILNAGDSMPLAFTLIAAPDSAANLYKLPILVDYFDSTGRNYSKTYITGIVVGNEPKLSTILAESTVYELNKIGTVTIKVVNKENIDVKFLEATLQKSDNYNIIGANTVYVGKLESDDYEDVEFSIIANKDFNSLPLLISYTDSNNNQYVEQVNVPFKIVSKEQLGMNGQKTPPWVSAVIILIIIAGIIFFMAARKKKK